MAAEVDKSPITAVATRVIFFMVSPESCSCSKIEVQLLSSALHAALLLVWGER
jgi:hypothetical protein